MEAKAKEITAEELLKKFENDDDFILINTLSHQSFCAHHIKGSINVPLDKIRSIAPEILPDKDQEIITYCRDASCGASVKAIKILHQMGYNNLSHYAGGLMDWMDRGEEMAGSGEYVEDNC